MLNKDSVEKALLINVVINKQWDLIITNNLTKDYFTTANRKLFDYIQDHYKQDKYPDIHILCYEFKIDDKDLANYTQIEDLQGLCNVIIDEYVREHVTYEIKELNQYDNELRDNPSSYVDRLANVCDRLKTLTYTDKTVGLFDNIAQILNIDPSNVISTGFKELDEKLVGLKRGEELVVIVGRTGQGKSWMGLKFALAAALQGERVGIYSGEMSLQQLQERVLCCAKQEYTSTSEDAMKFIEEHKPYIQILTQKELRRKANVNDLEAMIVRNKLSMLVIDQLSLMEDVTSGYNLPTRLQYGNITMDLFALSIKYGIPIVLLVQSNRNGANNNLGPELENIAESDAVAQNATRVVSMKKEDGVLTIKLVKNRYGTTEGTIKYDVDYGINKYKPIQDFAPGLTKINKDKARAIFGNSISKGGPF